MCYSLPCPIACKCVLDDTDTSKAKNKNKTKDASGDDNSSEVKGNHKMKTTTTKDASKKKSTADTADTSDDTDTDRSTTSSNLRQRRVLKKEVNACFNLLLASQNQKARLAQILWLTKTKMIRQVLKRKRTLLKRSTRNSHRASVLHAAILTKTCPLNARHALEAINWTSLATSAYLPVLRGASVMKEEFVVNARIRTWMCISVVESARQASTTMKMKKSVMCTVQVAASATILALVHVVTIPT